MWAFSTWQTIKKINKLTLAGQLTSIPTRGLASGVSVHAKNEQEIPENPRKSRGNFKTKDMQMTNFKMKMNAAVIEVIFVAIFSLGITSCKERKQNENTDIIWSAVEIAKSG